jgi:hypothetical protein
VEKHTERDTPSVIIKNSIRGTRRVPAEIRNTEIAKGGLCPAVIKSVSTSAMKGMPMTKPDFSDYERCRAENHEFFWRLAATQAAIRSRFCRFRQCRRLQVCCGPMLPSDHQKMQVRAQQEIGLSGRACATLPRCLAQISEPQYAAWRELVESLSEMRSHLSDAEIAYWVADDLRKTRPASAKESPTHP